MNTSRWTGNLQNYDQNSLQFNKECPYHSSHVADLQKASVELEEVLEQGFYREQGDRNSALYGNQDQIEYDPIRL